MSQVIEWNQISEGGNKSNSGSKAVFLRLNAGTYVVRLIGTLVAMNKFMVEKDGRWRSAVCEDPNNNPVTKNHGLNPSERYAINVIDRADGEVKILEGGVKVFGEFKKYYKHTQKNPGGRDGADFKIVVTGAGRSKKIVTTFERNTVLTDDEVNFLKERGLNKLEEIFKSTPDAELEAKLFGDSPSTSGTTEQKPSANDTLGVEAPSGNISFNTEEVSEDLPF